MYILIYFVIFGANRNIVTMVRVYIPSQKKFKNVLPIKELKEIKVDNYVLVSFKQESTKPTGDKSYLYYIGQIIRQIDASTFEATFLRTKRTKLNQGLVYGFPDVRDVCEFNATQVVGRLEKPIPYARGLLRFNYDFNAIEYLLVNDNK